MITTEFDDIRPYYDEEIPAAMQRIATSEYFPMLVAYAFPGKCVESVRDMFLSFRNIHDFQVGVMTQVANQIIERTITSCTYEGIENLDSSKSYLLVSNHRDIMLDATLLEYILWSKGHETAEITFGANLMTNPLVVDVGKSNKMFRVERGGSAKEFYKSSAHLSDYIRYVITQKHQDVWIAQRNGRTKDGNDTTDPGIISMFSMSASGDKVQGLADLNIVPISVSYEWEPCDYEKVRELAISRTRKYVKEPGEDLRSILKGIIQPKGCVHFTIGKPLSLDDLKGTATETGSARFNRSVAALIDSRIREGYKLFPNNYIAYDLRESSSRFSNHYSNAQKEAFLARLEGLTEFCANDCSHGNNCNNSNDCNDKLDAKILREIFLGIYANPVVNSISFSE